MRLPEFAIIIPACDESACIGPVLDELLGTVDPDKFVVAVGVNGSSDATAEIARQRPVLVAETKRREQWVRVKTGDFALAATALRQAGLVNDERDGQFLALKPGASTDQIVRLMVERGMPVHEIAFEQETLESFYLGLMKKAKSE